MWYTVFIKTGRTVRMAGEGYELLALFMRYVFVALGALIVWNTFRWMRKDAKEYRRWMKRLPDAGLIGEIVNLNTGERLPLPREGIVGAASSCDVRVKGNGVGRKHVLFSFVNGKGLCLTPCGHKRFVVEDTEMAGPVYAIHGTQIVLGDVPLRVRLFAGLDVPHPTAFEQEDRFEEDPSALLPEEPEMPFSDDLFPGDLFPDETAYPENEPEAALFPEEAPVREEPADDPGEDQSMSYQSPLPQRHRRGRRA